MDLRNRPETAKASCGLVQRRSDGSAGDGEVLTVSDVGVYLAHGVCVIWF